MTARFYCRAFASDGITQISCGIWAAVLMFLITGCGGGGDDVRRVPVAGTVKIDGQPLPGAEVSLYADGEARVATTDKDGYYQIPGGAQSLKYIVVVSKYEGVGTIKLDPAAGMDSGQLDAMRMADGTGRTIDAVAKQLVPEKYSSRDKSELSVVVPLEGTQSADFDLKTK